MDDTAVAEDYCSYVEMLHSKYIFDNFADVLKCSVDVAEKYVQDIPAPTIEPSEFVVDFLSKPSVVGTFDLIIRKGVISARGNVKEVADSIVKSLSRYSYAKRAVLILAAFAVCYREVLAVVSQQKWPRLLEKTVFFPQVKEFMAPKTEPNMAFPKLNGFTNLTIKFMELILQLDHLSKEKDSISDNSSLLTDIKAIVQSYSLTAIQALVSSMRLLNDPPRYMTEIEKEFDDSYTKKELTELQEIVENYNMLIKGLEDYETLQSCIGSKGGIEKVMTYIMSPCHPHLWRKEKAVTVNDELSGKNVLLFISEPENTKDDDIAILERIHDWLEEEKQHDYKIVWIPVVDEWNTDAKKSYGSWKRKMPWYVVNCETDKPIALHVGTKYIKERWHFSNEPMVVALDKHGALESLYAKHIIMALGTHAFPLSSGTQLLRSDDCMRPIIYDIIHQQIHEEKYILLYGGNHEFSMNVAELEESVREKITLRPFAIGEKISNKEIVHFWTRIESLLFVRMRMNLSNDVTKQIQKLLSLKTNKSGGWAMLCKGPKVVACASGSMILQAVVEYQKWTIDLGRKNLEVCLQDFFDTIEDEP